MQQKLREVNGRQSSNTGLQNHEIPHLRDQRNGDVKNYDIRCFRYGRCMAELIGVRTGHAHIKAKGVVNMLFGYFHL